MSSLGSPATSASTPAARVRSSCAKLPARPCQQPARAGRTATRLRCSANAEQKNESSEKPAAGPGGSAPAAPPNDASPDEINIGPSVSRGRGGRVADSTDPIASALTRRFGLAGGLAWLGILTFGVSEQVKTRLEYAREAEGTKDVAEAKEVTTTSGLKYVDLRRGGGETAPQRGFLMAADVSVKLGEQVMYDTKQKGKPLAWLFLSRPFYGAICPGFEEGVSTMRVGGIRRMTVPAELGFPGGARFPGGEIPEGSTLEYTVELLRVSVPPS